MCQPALHRPASPHDAYGGAGRTVGGPVRNSIPNGAGGVVRLDRVTARPAPDRDLGDAEFPSPRFLATRRLLFSPQVSSE